MIHLTSYYRLDIHECILWRVRGDIKELQVQRFSLQLKNGWFEVLELVALFLFKTGTCDA